MWKSPKMIAFTLLTAGLYATLIFPFHQYTLFGGHADFGRLGIGIPVAFSFMFGPATAWGAAIGNVIRDAATSKLNVASIFGFVGNFFIGYVPYKLWSVITTEKPDLKSLKKLGLFAGATVFACCICGVIVGWGLYWLGWAPFMPTALLVVLTDALWAIVVGSVLLALTYGYISKRKLLYTDVLNISQTRDSWSKTRSVAIFAFAVSAVLCFILGLDVNVSPLVLLPIVAVSLVAISVACR